jgi:hypothetical protein
VMNFRGGDVEAHRDNERQRAELTLRACRNDEC